MVYSLAIASLPLLPVPARGAKLLSSGGNGWWHLQHNPGIIAKSGHRGLNKENLPVEAEFVIKP